MTRIDFYLNSENRLATLGSIGVKAKRPMPIALASHPTDADRIAFFKNYR